MIEQKPREFWVYRNMEFPSFYLFENKQPDYMMTNHEEIKCVEVSSDVDSYIYFLQHKHDLKIKELAAAKEEIEQLKADIKEREFTTKYHLNFVKKQEAEIEELEADFEKHKDLSFNEHLRQQKEIEKLRKVQAIQEAGLKDISYHWEVNESQEMANYALKKTKEIMGEK